MVICACPSGPEQGPYRALVGWVPGGWYQGGYTGGYPGGLYRGTTQPHCFARGECPDSEAGPVGPCKGLEWVVRVLGRTGGWTAPRYHPPGPVSHSVASLYLGPSECRPGPIRARLRSISQKLSKNDEVSPKYLKKACHSPYIPNGPQKSPL